MIRDQINQRITQFVNDIDQLIAREALTAVRAALAGSPAPAPARGRVTVRAAKSATPKAKAKAKAKAVVPASKAASGLDDAIRSYVKANPGASVEQMVDALGVQTTRLKPRVAALVEAKAIRKTGKTRGTRYFPS